VTTTRASVDISRVDSLGLVDGQNTYVYVRSNPIARIDPLGLLTTFGCAPAQNALIQSAANDVDRASDTCIDCPDRPKFKNLLKNAIVRCLDSDEVEGSDGIKRRVCAAGNVSGLIGIGPSGFKRVCGLSRWAYRSRNSAYDLGSHDTKADETARRCFKCAL